MSITQTVEVPDNRWLTVKVPPEVPVGRNILTYTPAVSATSAGAAVPKRKPISRYFGILSPNTYGDGVAYQRSLRDEWDD
jgi:hypothetical protein